MSRQYNGKPTNKQHPINTDLKEAIMRQGIRHSMRYQVQDMTFCLTGWNNTTLRSVVSTCPYFPWTDKNHVSQTGLNTVLNQTTMSR